MSPIRPTVLAHRGRPGRAGRQAERFGAELLILSGVDRGWVENGQTRLRSEGGDEISAEVALAAPGMEWRQLEVEGVDQLLGRGVYYGAGRSEAAQCRETTPSAEMTTSW